MGHETALAPSAGRDGPDGARARDATPEQELAAEIRVVESLGRIGAALASELDPDRLMQRITDEARTLVGAQFGALFYGAAPAPEAAADGGTVFTRYTLSGLERSAFAAFPMPRRTAIFAVTFDGAVVRCEDVTRDPRYGLSPPYHGLPPGHPVVRSYLAAPVTTSEGIILGGLFFGHEQPGVFTARDERAITSLVGLAAASLGNARLFQKLTVSDAALKRSATRYRLVAESSQDGLWFWDIATGQVEWNDRLVEMTGLGDGDWEGNFASWLERLHPDDQPRMRAALDAHLTKREPYRVEAFRRRDAKGEYRWYSTTGQAEWNAEGKPVLMAGAVTDITDKKLAEDERRRDADAQRLLAEASAILGASIDYTTTLANVARAAVPGFADWCAVDLVEGSELRRLGVAHVDPSKVKLAHELQRRWPTNLSAPHGVANVIRTGKAEVFENIGEDVLTARIEDPELLAVARELGFTSSISVPLLVRGEALGAISFVNAESGRHYRAADVAFAEEVARRASVAIENARLFNETRAAVSERDRALADLRELANTLEHRIEERTAALVEANRELESFSYTVSHDLRAPVRHIAGFVDLLRNAAGERLDERGSRYLDTIGSAALHMGSLIDGLLAFSRMGRAELKKHRVDLDEMVRSVVRELEPELATRAVRWSIGPLPVVAADATMIRTVLSNLIGNAVKYTRGREPATITIGAKREGAEDVIWVGDDGVGFNMEYAHKLFGVFQRLHADSQFEGTGIGLATARRIVLRHGGRMWAEGAEGRGATFFFSLPHEE